jgi:hypothetical protein
MAEKTTYFALVDSRSSRERPRTVLRRVDNAHGRTDEMFSRDLVWEASPLLHGAERGDTMLDFTEISADEANRIVERIKAEAAQADG